MTPAQTLEIIGLGHRGEGIAYVEGAPVFVPHTLAGETIIAEVSGNRGRLLDIVEPSPDRVAPFCPHFGRCGGCQLQHMAPSSYGAFKRDLVVSALAHAGVEADVAEPVIAHGTGRRRVTLHATRHGAGFMGLRSHDIHPIEACPILVPALVKAPEIAARIAALLGPCDVAFTVADTGLDVAIKGKGLKPSAAIAELARRYDIARVSLNGEPLYSVRAPLLALGKAGVALPVAGFLQATAAAEAELATRVTDAARGLKSMADLFSGIGPFALRLAQIAPVFAADSDKAAIDALAKAVRTTTGLKPLSAECRDLFREPLTPFELNRFDCVVLDPPRAGAKAQVLELAKAKVKRVIYVACDPQSFGRDAAILVAAGYRIGTVTPVDQFAFSAHIELLAVFDR
ncbi:class I SAM-dependent RNA methyltransferase [Pelagibacterium limicola]|uniref:class I SAM-dependent RNA methyltransferase n=1 Tax=Pelagibacterium limicola TaxID=2791022 RepID=UPI0018AFB83F|nr:class I SAM-dependent RNA methyltransferase [Pelagibacterium limicola]